MKVLVTGAAGMIGRKLCERLVRDGALDGTKIDALVAIDVVKPSDFADAAFIVQSEAADIADAKLAPRLIADRPDVIFHLAAIVSGEAEVDFDKGYAINLDGTRYIFDAIRHEHGGSEWRLQTARCLRIVRRRLRRAFSDGHRR